MPQEIPNVQQHAKNTTKKMPKQFKSLKRIRSIPKLTKKKHKKKKEKNTKNATTKKYQNFKEFKKCRKGLKRFYCIGATIRTRRDIKYLLYAKLLYQNHMINL